MRSGSNDSTCSVLGGVGSVTFSVDPLNEGTHLVGCVEPLPVDGDAHVVGGRRIGPEQLADGYPSLGLELSCHDRTIPIGRCGTLRQAERMPKREGDMHRFWMRRNWRRRTRSGEAGAVTAELRVPSTDGVDLALHDLGGDGPPLLLCHATGFHGRAYLPFVAHLTSAFHVWALDFRAHGASTPPADEYFTWAGMAHDVLAAVDEINRIDGTPGRALKTFGHSMGGAAILIAELSRPNTFEQAYLYEPIVFPSGWARSEEQNSSMSGPARKRREVFASRAEAMWRYASRPPLGGLRADCLAAYVQYGFDDLPDGTVRLACRAEHEARTFEAAGLMTSDKCAGVKIPVVVALGGADAGSNTAQMALPAANTLPYGRLKEYAHLGHFGPLEDPLTVSIDVRETFGAGSA